MSLQDDLNTLATLGGKVAGHLIRHDDWNKLVSVLTDVAQATKALVDANLAARMTAIEATVSAMHANVDSLNARVQAVEASISPLLQYYVVTMQASKSAFVVGEIGEITAKVTDLKGQPVNPRPWVDFVCSWGTLRAAPGFTASQVGDGGNSLSVQVNAQGVAKVQLSATVGNKVKAADESSVHTMMLSLTDDGQQSVAQALLDAPTPSDARAQKAFKVMSREYERSNSAWAAYANATYTEYRGPYTTDTGEWVNHYSTVMAFARPDGDPLTPDGSRGSASIQANFRNWVSSWGGYHVIDRDDLLVTLGDKYKHIVDAEPEGPLAGLLHGVKEGLTEKEGWGREKYIVTARDAMDKVITTASTSSQEKVLQAAQALSAQAASEGIHVAGGAASQSKGVPVMEAHVALATTTQAVSAKVSAVEQAAVQTKGLSASVSVLEGRMQSTEQMGQAITGSLSLLNEHVRGINVLDDTSLKGGVQKISAEIASIRARLG
jgi:hypothetical protein